MKNQDLKPCVDQRTAGGMGVLVSIETPDDRIRAALIIGQRGHGRRCVQHDLVLLLRHLRHGQRHRRRRHVGRHIDAAVEPLPRDRGRDVGLVLVVGADHLDIEIQVRFHLVDRELRRRHGSRPGVVAIGARQVGQHADRHFRCVPARAGLMVGARLSAAAPPIRVRRVEITGIVLPDGRRLRPHRPEGVQTQRRRVFNQTQPNYSRLRFGFVLPGTGSARRSRDSPSDRRFVASFRVVRLSSAVTGLYPPNLSERGKPFGSKRPDVARSATQG